MRVKIIGVLVALGILISLTAGCGGGASSIIKEIMQLLPDDTDYLMYADIASLRSDRDFEDQYDDLESMFEYDLDMIGLDASDVDSVTFAVSDDYYCEWTFITGDFDLDDFRDALEDDYYDEDEYRGVEIWSDGYDAYALIDDMIVYCDDEDALEDAIKRSVGEGSSSMYDDEDFADVFNQTPSGVLVGIGEGGWSEYRCVGFSFSKASRDSVELNACFKFSSAGKAEDYERDIEDEVEYMGDVYDIDVRRSGDCVIATAEMDIDDFYPWDYY